MGIKLQILFLLTISVTMTMSQICQKKEYLRCPRNVILLAGTVVRLTCRLENPNSLNWGFNSNFIAMGGHIEDSYKNNYSIVDGDLEIKMIDSVGRYDCHSTDSGEHYYAEVYSLFSGPQCQYSKKELDATPTVNCTIDYAGNGVAYIALEDSRGNILHSVRKDSQSGKTNISFEKFVEADAPWYRIHVRFQAKCDLVGEGECALNEVEKTFDYTTGRSPKQATLDESSKIFDPTASSPGPNYLHESPRNDFVWLIFGSSGVSYSAIFITALFIFIIYKMRRHFCRKSTPESPSSIQSDQEILTEEPLGDTSEEPLEDTSDEPFRDTSHASTNPTLEHLGIKLKISKPIDSDECCASTDTSPLKPPEQSPPPKQSFQVQDGGEESEDGDEEDDADEEDDLVEHETTFNK